MIDRLSRRLGTFDAVVIGLGSMIGAGVFVAIGPAAGAAGSGLLIGLGLAGAIAYCNALSSAQLAAVHPESGGTYAYGTKQLGRFWGYLAGWGFIAGKVASCAAMALTFGYYVFPSQGRWLGIAAVAVLTAVNLLGIRKTALLTRVIVASVLLALAVAVYASLAGGTVDTGRLSDPLARGASGILQAAGFLFFAFAGYARIATLGEEVIEPTKTIPRAIPIALFITLAVYACVSLATLLATEPGTLAGSTAPLETAVRNGTYERLAPVIQVGAAVASLGVLLSLLVGVSRTTFAMAANRDLPHGLAAVHPRRKTPYRAELIVGAVVIAIVGIVDLRGAIGFSSFLILAYYAIANASAFTLSSAQRRWPRFISLAGGIGCLIVAASLPSSSVLTGLGVLALGAIAFVAGRRRAGP